MNKDNNRPNKLEYMHLFQGIDEKNKEYLLNIRNSHGQPIFSREYLRNLSADTIAELVQAFANKDYERISQIESRIEGMVDHTPAVGPIPSKTSSIEELSLPSVKSRFEEIPGEKIPSEPSENERPNKLEYMHLFQEIDEKNKEYLLNIRNSHGQPIFSREDLRNLSADTIEELARAYKTGDYARIHQIESRIEGKVDHTPAVGSVPSKTSSIEDLDLPGEIPHIR